MCEESPCYPKRLNCICQTPLVRICQRDAANLFGMPGGRADFVLNWFNNLWSAVQKEDATSMVELVG